MSAFKVVQYSVPDAVRTLITKNHAIFQCLKLRIINYRSLAEKIKPQVEEITSAPVKLNTIVAAIMRFSDTLEKQSELDPLLVLKDAKLSLTDGIADMTLSLGTYTISSLWVKLYEIYSKLESQVNIFQLPASAEIIGDNDDIRTLHRELSEMFTSQIKCGLAKLDLKVSQNTLKIPGIPSFISELLYRNGIQLVNALFSYEDILLIMNESEATKSYELIRNEINRQIDDDIKNI